ncbi:MAG: bifunctional phosphoribosylaminoimidazolecarboxamide formyltransferase/IMP cyclohydrolase, partial [Thermoplasmata archaeon]
MSDVAGLAELARGLERHGIELWATEGTRRAVREAVPNIRSVEELTGIGRWFGGRIKTLHPGVLGGILAPGTPEGRKELAERGLLAFDLVVVNFYPFESRARDSPGPV